MTGDDRKDGKHDAAEKCRGKAGVGRQMQRPYPIGGNVEQQVVRAVRDDRDAGCEQYGNRMTTKHFADRHGRRLGSFENSGVSAIRARM
jgi:hypothetical protein